MSQTTNLGRVMPVDKGAYNSETTYAKLDMVHTADSTYVSLVDNNVGNPVTDTTKWQCYADGKPATAAAAAANTAAGLANAARLAIQQDLAAKADIAKLLSGEIKPKYAEFLAWMATRGQKSVSDVMRAWIQPTGGEASIDSSKGATFRAIVAVEDFSATSLISSGFNLLRLQTNKGPAVAVGTGWAFPVPTLSASSATIGTANANNGVLFTDSEGANLTPTVRFLAGSAAPTSVNDGIACTYVDKDGRRHYTTSGPGWLIVTGITWAETCAHLGWSGRYDEFVSPTDANDNGTIISLSLLGTMRAVGSGDGLAADRADYRNDTSMTKTVKVGTSNSLTWATVDNEDGTYTHSANISSMLVGGAAEILLSGGAAWQTLTVEGTTVSFTDSLSAVASGYLVKFALATPTTSTPAVPTVLTCEDWGIWALIGASGAAAIEAAFSQGWNDTLANEPAIREAEVGVLTEALVAVMMEIAALKHGLDRRGDLVADSVNVHNIPRRNGTPMILYAAGVPSASLVPVNWDVETMGAWTGIPANIGDIFINTTPSAAQHLYVAINNTAVSDWV